MLSKKILFCFILLGIITVIIGCSIGGNEDLITETKNMELDGLKSVAIDLTIGAGELNIDSRTEKLMESEFKYNVKQWKPVIEYSKIGNAGTLKIEQGTATNNISSVRLRYEWNLNFNKEISTDIKVLLGAGKGTLRLNGMNINSVTVKMGAGELDMDLSGDWAKNMKVDIIGGVGSATIVLPKKVGVLVKIEKGIGKINATGFILKGDDYINEVYGKSDVTIIVNIVAGIGETNLKLSNLSLNL